MFIKTPVDFTKDNNRKYNHMRNCVLLSHNITLSHSVPSDHRLSDQQEQDKNISFSTICVSLQHSGRMKKYHQGELTKCKKPKGKINKDRSTFAESKTTLILRLKKRTLKCRKTVF